LKSCSIIANRNLSQKSFVLLPKKIIELASIIALSKKNEFHIVLSGGETPIALYSALVNLKTDWGKWHFWFSDERCLEKMDPDLNYTLVYNQLLKYIPFNPMNIHKINSFLGPNLAACEYSNFLKYAPVFDLVILGIGFDGHTASIFPKNQSIEVENGDAIAVYNSPKFPSERVSMSINRLCKSNIVIFLAQENKKQILDKFLNNDEMPANNIKGLKKTFLFTKI
jgi:6-phosphogluconolactonase